MPYLNLSIQLFPENTTSLSLNIMHFIECMTRKNLVEINNRAQLLNFNSPIRFPSESLPPFRNAEMLIELDIAFQTSYTTVQFKVIDNHTLI